MHHVRVSLVKVLNQKPDRVIAGVVAVHIDDMRAILEGLMSFTDIAVYMIYGQTFPELVVLIDEDYIGILKLLETLSLLQHAGIYQAAVVSGTSFVRSV